MESELESNSNSKAFDGYEISSLGSGDDISYWKTLTVDLEKRKVMALYFRLSHLCSKSFVFVFRSYFPIGRKESSTTVRMGVEKSKLSLTNNMVTLVGDFEIVLFIPRSRAVVSMLLSYLIFPLPKLDLHHALRW